MSGNIEEIFASRKEFFWSAVGTHLNVLYHSNFDYERHGSNVSAERTGRDARRVMYVVFVTKTTNPAAQLRRQKREHDEYPKIIAIVTGTGPQRSHYLPLLKEFKATHPFVGIQTLWLEAARSVLIMSSKTSADWVPRP